MTEADRRIQLQYKSSTFKKGVSYNISHGFSFQNTLSTCA